MTRRKWAMPVAFIGNYYRLFDADPAIVDTLSEEGNKLPCL
jgi:hypothetical protein